MDVLCLALLRAGLDRALPSGRCPHSMLGRLEVADL